MSPENLTEQEHYMRQALEIAALARGRTSPNPLVGAVLVRDGRVVGQGWHRQAGTPHAEIHALAQAGELARNATMYVTLEPCSHHGRTGPCTDAVIAAGVRKVIVAMTDPNPQVSGQGIARLRAAGIEVVEGVLAAEAARLNRVFTKWIATGMPYGTLKWAMTLDGKIATQQGHSRWITGPAARQRVHEFRDCHDAILAGIGTVLADNPELTTRLPQGGKNPLRVIVDSRARIPLTAKVVTDGLAPTLLAVGPEASPAKIKELESYGVEVWPLSATADGLDLRQLFSRLGSRNITSVFVEGGANINGSCLKNNLIDTVHAFIASKLIGGTMAPGPFGGQGCDRMDQALELEDLTQEWIGDDLLISGDVRQREGRHVYRTCGRIG
ncbi:MAG TPA: bifunctional diaminohydroxyphosphoribosylaminopyrimidine deaminase/5-amino-6-(5-phosphoribosylamino)uracil reductase RibD [Patescibacteria group bacterium]|nr:bifunctional diaminohydroxyphosphoribosylaminopyrimidine deaminase/5-amino-6-(5-phosphoribosylamino)uracil reductase RibD [Patescibacteria group bacterium]